MTNSEAIEQIMLKNGYFAPLKLLYKEIWNYKEKENVKGKTPNNTIQERVQRDERFTRIGLGIYALTEYLDKLPKLSAPTSETQKQERKHATIQGMLLEIGNQTDGIADTYTNDKKWIFDGKTLGGIATLSKVPSFTFEHIINDSVAFSDVIWFNQRSFPQVLFEVEHSTDFRDAFVKFMELQDFQTRFYCVSSKDRFDKFKREKNKSAFSPICDRVGFLTYEEIEDDYKRAIQKVNIKY